MHSIMKRVFFILPVAVLAVRVRKADVDVADSSYSDSSSDEATTDDTSGATEDVTSERLTTDTASDSNSKWELSEGQALEDREEFEIGVLTYVNNYGGGASEVETDKVELNITEMNADEEYDVQDLLRESNDALAAGLFGGFSGHVDGMKLNFDKQENNKSGELGYGMRSLVHGYGDRSHKKRVDTAGELNPVQHPKVDEYYSKLDAQGREVANAGVEEYVDVIGEQVFDTLINQQNFEEIEDIVEIFQLD